MKIGMNSQTLRIIWGNGNISDYNITDGSTASKFMKIVGGDTPTQSTLGDYNSAAILDESDTMSWGNDHDKMDNITYTEMGRREVSMIDSSCSSREHDNYGYYAPPQPSRRSPYGATFYQPITRPIKQSPPPPRHTFSKTIDNEKNFKKLFGK